MEHVIYVALGSNRGDREAMLAAARRSMPPEIEIKATSAIYETAPWGYTEQPAFLNQVVKATTELDAAEVLDHLKGIERDVGRQETFRYGPREIDLDLLFYDDLTLDTPQLTIPHPHLHERAFVLVPLADLDPELEHPVLGVTVKELRREIGEEGVALWEDWKGEENDVDLQ